MSLHPEVLGSLFEISSDPVIGIDRSHTVVFANPAAAQLGIDVGTPAAEVLQEHILEDPAEQFIATLHSFRGRRANVSVRRLEDTTVCTFTLLTDVAPSPGHARAIQELSSSLMTARLAMDALTCRINADSDPALHDASCTLYKQYYMMRRNCQHLNQVCSISGGGLPYQPRVLDLGTLCRELCDTVGRLVENMGISILFRADMAMHLTVADRDLLEQMLTGLLTNSIAHCKPGDVIRTELVRQGERFIIAVNDPGTGIPPEKLAGIFNDSLYGSGTDTTAGAGLGLLIARGIAERHGGSLILESRPGQGTSVRVSIPFKQSEDTTVNTPVASYRSDGMNTVLTELSPLLDRKIFTRRMFD